MATKHILLILPILLALTIHLVLTETFAQQGSMATLQNIDATYAVSIVPSAAQKRTYIITILHKLQFLWTASYSNQWTTGSRR